MSALLINYYQLYPCLLYLNFKLIFIVNILNNNKQEQYIILFIKKEVYSALSDFKKAIIMFTFD